MVTLVIMELIIKNRRRKKYQKNKKQLKWTKVPQLTLKSKLCLQFQNQLVRLRWNNFRCLHKKWEIAKYCKSLKIHRVMMMLTSKSLIGIQRRWKTCLMKARTKINQITHLQILAQTKPKVQLWIHKNCLKLKNYKKLELKDKTTNRYFQKVWKTNWLTQILIMTNEK